ncbi:MAG TPA: ABC transporter permease [Actinocrinis sp.]|nr:ABC transporter permease [Actinocrinis sp.]
MSSLTYAVTDSATMLRRTLRHVLRYPAMLAASLGVPVILLLFFVGLLGRTLGAGLTASHVGGVGHGSYIDYVAPAIVLLTVASGCMATSVAVCVDTTEGIINRFRTMSISRSSLLTGHVIASVIQTFVSVVLVIGVAVAMGWRPSGTALGWLAAVGLIVLLSFALTWLAVAIGLISKTPESSSNTPMLIQFLPFLGSSFVPAASMPAGVRWFAEYQPFTPLNQTLRGLLNGGAIGHDALISIAWCLGILVVGYWWARTVFQRGRVR